MKARLLLSLWCAWSQLGSVATAQDIDPHWTPPPPEVEEPSEAELEAIAATGAEVPRGPLALRAEVGITTRADERTNMWVLSPVLSGAYRLNTRWAFGVDWGVAFAIDTPAHGDSEQRVGSGNPLFSAAYLANDSARSRLDLWLGVTAPLAWLAEGVQRGFSRGMYAHALAMRGLWNPWLWAPEQIGAATGALWIVDPSKDFRLRLEGGLGATLPLSDVTQDIADLFLQLAASIELRAGVLSLGTRLQSVLMTADSDPLQLAIAPYLRVNARTWALDARLLINLDEPLGVAGAGLDAWGVLLSLEVTP